MLLFQYGTQNNPSLVEHGSILQRISADDGRSWSQPTNVSNAGVSVGYPGGTPGPGLGVQVPGTGTVAFCAWGNRAKVPFSRAWGDAANFGNFITYSTDYGRTWNATNPISGEVRQVSVFVYFGGVPFNSRGCNNGGVAKCDPGYQREREEKALDQLL